MRESKVDGLDMRSLARALPKVVFLAYISLILLKSILELHVRLWQQGFCHDLEKKILFLDIFFGADVSPCR
jgi:hypothetical protein